MVVCGGETEPWNSGPRCWGSQPISSTASCPSEPQVVNCLKTENRPFLVYGKPSLVAQVVKHLSKVQKTRVLTLGWEDPMEKEMATHSSTLAWKIPWTEEPGGLQSMGSQTAGHDWVTSLSLSVYGSTDMQHTLPWEKGNINAMNMSTVYHLGLCCCLVATSCLTLCDPVDCTLPGPSVHGIFQARILEQAAISDPKRSSHPKGQIRFSGFSCIAGGFFTTGHWVASVSQAPEWPPALVKSLLHRLFSSMLGIITQDIKFALCFPRPCIQCPFPAPQQHLPHLPALSARWPLLF